jgi:CRP/FNR family cyclic AMP-dependent transcriptional regulator
VRSLRATPDAVAKALASSPILKLLSQTGRARLAGAGAPIGLEPGELLCQKGDPGDAIYVVLEGEIEIRTTSPGGREVRFASFGPGSVVGEMAALDGEARSADMVAARRAQLWRIPRAPLIGVLENEPAAAVALVAELARRLRAANSALESTQTLDLGGRLAQFLLESSGARSLVPLTQTEMARRLGVSRESVNRKLAAWARSGWISLSHSGVRLDKPEALAPLTHGVSPS